MKSTQPKKEEKIKSENKLIKNSFIASVIGVISWIALFFVFEPLAGLYKFGKSYYQETFMLLKDLNFYMSFLFVGILFFFFFYLTLKYKKLKSARVIMWMGIILYALFYFGYLFLLLFFRFTDL